VPAWTVVEFEARGAVAAALPVEGSEVLLSGAAGTGKSVGVLMRLHLLMLDKRGGAGADPAEGLTRR
jgi:hypothetical protein